MHHEKYLTDQDTLIDFEEKSEHIDPKTFKKYNKYNKSIRYIYNKEVYHAALCHKKPKKEFECYQAGPSNYIKIHCIYISQKELWKMYEKVIRKDEQKEELTDKEAQDMAFVSKFIGAQHRLILDAMISKYIKIEAK